MKRVISCIAILLVMSAYGASFSVYAGDLPPIPLTTQETRIPGDADDNKEVTLRDAACITRYLAGGWNVTINEKNADVNGDNKVDLKDAVLVRRYLAGGWGVTLQ